MNIINIDSAQQFIVTTLKKHSENGMVHLEGSNPFVSLGYDINFEKVLVEYKKYLSIKTPIKHDDEYNKQENRCKSCLLDVIWNMCRIGVLRPGQSFAYKCVFTSNNKANEGFSLTHYGKIWLQNLDDSGLLPADPNAISLQLEKHQNLYGINYFKRAKEAVNCYMSGNYLACCVMCGAAAESILLSVAFTKQKRDDVIKKYCSASGRNRIESLLFGQAEKRIKDTYYKYADLIKFWRDESCHGHDTDIDHNEAYISMITLLKMALFMKENFGDKSPNSQIIDQHVDKENNKQEATEIV